MSINEELSFTEYTLTEDTTDFIISFDRIGGSTDEVSILVNNTPIEELVGYTVLQVNFSTWQVDPALPAGTVVRLARTTNLDKMVYVFTAGSKFIAKNIDANFQQIQHSQQEIRDRQDKLEDDATALLLEVQDVKLIAEQAAADANEALDKVDEILNTGVIPASMILTNSNQNQQQVNDFGGATWHSKVGGYELGATVKLDNGDVVKATIPNNTNNPNVDMAGWVIDSPNIIVSNIAELRQKTSALVGQIAQTQGYYTTGDGGQAKYRWVGGTEDNGFNKISGWELIFTGEIDVRCGGAKVDLPVITNQTAVISTVTQQVNALGGGIVHFPAGTFYASVKAQSNVEIRGKINIDMTPATKIQAFAAVVGNDGANILADKPFFRAKNFELDGSFNGVLGGITGLRVTSYACEFENIVSHSSRYDGMALSGNNANFNTFTKCIFRHCKRNVVSYTGGHDNTFIECQFIEDVNVSGESLYLFDIEPNDANGIWYNVTFKNCTFDRVTQTANGAVLIDQKEANQVRRHNVTFDGCKFKNFAYISPRGDYSMKGFNVINCTFDFFAFSSAGALSYTIESGNIYGNIFRAALTYRVNFLGDVVFENNYFAGGIDTQASSTATFRKNTFASGVTPIAPVNRIAGIGTAAGRNVSDTVNADIPSNSLIRKSFALRYVDRRTLTNFDYNTLAAGEYVLHQASTGQLNAPPNPYASLYVMRNYLDDNQLTVVGHDYSNGGLVTRGKQNGNWSGWAKHYHTLNTTVDANGFIKAASPIVRMFADGIEVNEEAALQDISFEKLGVGDYLLKGSTGFAQEGWYVETPKDANGNVLFSVIYTTLENGDISVKTYKKKFDLETASIVADLNNPVDITESRWIDLRLHEVQETLDMPVYPEGV